MSSSAAFSGRHYTLERDGRELQPKNVPKIVSNDYTLERDGRELQPRKLVYVLPRDYTLERDGRELQQVNKRMNY